MSEPYRIQLKSPHVAFLKLPLLPKIKDKIDWLLSLGVIEQVDEPTHWCAPIIVAPKAQGIRLCVDLSRLNKSVMRQRHVLPFVDQVLA